MGDWKNEWLYPTAAHRYLEERADRIRTAGSRRTTLGVLRGVQQANPELRVSEFREEHLLAFLRRTTTPGTGLRYRSDLVGFFRWAKRAGLAADDPAAYLAETFRPKPKGSRQHNWLEDAEIHALLALPPAGPIGLRDRMALALPLFTGLRRAEYAAPPRHYPACPPDCRRHDTRRGLAWGRVRPREIKVCGKGEKWETVGIAPQLAAILTEWRTHTEEALGRPVGLHDPVLVRALNTSAPGEQFGHGRSRHLQWGKGLSDHGIANMVRLYGQALGYENLAPHDLRRTFAFSLKRAGVPIDEISRMMRHEDIATTVRYLKADKSDLDGHWGKVGTGA